MNIFTIALITLNLLFGGLAVFFSFLEERRKKQIKDLQKLVNQQTYEISILKNLSSQIGYELNIKKVVENIIASIEKLLSVTTVSYAVIDSESISLKTYIKESVGDKFISEVKKIVLDSVYTLDSNARSLKILDTTQGEEVAGNDMLFPLSYFTIPLIVDNKITGVINFSSKNKNNYDKEQMTALYRLIAQATQAVERLEEVINTEKSKLNSMLLSIPSGAIVFLLEQGDSLKLTTINTAAISFLHIDGEADAIKVITSFGREFNVLNQIKECLDKKEPKVIENVVLFEKTFKIFVNPVFLSTSGKIIGCSITMEDLTVEKQIQEVRETFTNMVVHELRAPLTSIKGACELVLSDKLKEEDRKRMLTLIKQSSESLLSEIGELLDAAKIDAGKFVIKKDIAEVASLVEQKIEAYSLVAQNKHITVKSDIKAKLPDFEFDRERIGQVLNNLLSNSIKFTHEGGEIDIIVDKVDDSASITVKDNGIGIPEDVQKKLFTKYTQANTAGRSSGTGLGLYIAKTIVESHGGKIWIDGHAQKGTTISFTIPLLNAREHVEKPAAPLLTSAPALSSGRIVN